MRRLWPIVLLLFACSVPVRAQFVSVTATVQDPSGKVYQNCSGNVSFVPSPTATTVPTIGGSVFQTIYVISSCDSFGKFSLTLPDNLQISDGHTGAQASQWAFFIQSANVCFAGQKVSFSATLTITGSSQNISAALQSAAATLPSCGGGGGTGPALQTNSAPNTSQTLLNLKNGTNTSLSSDGSGGVTVAVPTPGLSSQLLYNTVGTIGSTAGITTPDGNILNVKGPVPWVDATQYGARALTTNFNTITVTTNGTTTVSTTGVSDFITNDGIVIPTAGNATAQSTPSAPTVTVVNANGSTTLNYKCVALDNKWGMTAASAAGTTTTAPTVFGAPAVAISSISRSSNVVTVTTSSNMPFSSGTYHAVIANVTGGSTQFSGLQLVTVSNFTSLTYSQTGSNESGTVSASSYVLFENAFVVTQVQATAGDNHLVLTTDVNHNIIFVSSNSRPTMVFLDGINFSGATPAGYANGPFPVTAVTANTITVATSYTSPVTTTATASSTLATSSVAQMTVTTYPVIDVACPAISGTTKYYAIYRGNTAIGFTPWLKNIFEDYGPAFTETGFISPPAMSLPATPPVSAQNQVYTGQITGIAGSTLTVSPSVPASVTSVTADHDNGVALQNAVAASCSNGGGGSSNSQGFASVYIPRVASGGTTSWVYLVSAPVDLSVACNRVSIIDGGEMFLDGTIYADSAANFEWKRPQDLSGWTNSTNGVAGTTTILGHASPMMVPGTIVARIVGIGFNTLSNGEVGLMFIGANSLFQDDVFSTNGTLGLTSIPFMTNTGNGFQDWFHNTYWSGDRHIQYPVPESGQNTETGQVAWWPVPVFDLNGPQYPYITMTGINYGNIRGFRIDNLYGNGGNPPLFSFSDIQTFQDPWQPSILMWGENGGRITRLNVQRVQMDSVQMPVVSCVALGKCVQVYTSDFPGTASDGTFPTYTGFPSDFALETLSHAETPAQNTNGFSVSSTGVALTGAMTGTGSMVLTGIKDGLVPVSPTTANSCTLGTSSAGCAGTFVTGYSFNQNSTAAQAVTYTLPTAAAGLQYCVSNSYNGSAANTGVLTIATSASGQFIIFTDGTLSATGGNVTSGGAGADSACVVGVDSTHWQLFVENGTWSKH